MMYVHVCSIHNINISKLEVLILLVFRLGDGTKVVCDQVRVVGFGMQDSVTSKEQIFLFIRIQRGHIATPQGQLSDESQDVA